VIAQFFMVGWDYNGFDKNHTGTRYAELVFLEPVGFVGHVVHSGASGTQNVVTLFFMLGWDQYGFNKKCHRTHYAKLVCLLVGYASYVVYSGASLAQNVDSLFFMLEFLVRFA
jgi:hypothetical protein